MYFKNICELDRAVALIPEKFADFQIETEIISVGQSLGRITAKDYFSNENLPAFNRSTVDGFAVISENIKKATQNDPIKLKNIGSIEMGSPIDFLVNNLQCAYVPTGGMVPGGADTMVMIEDTNVEYKDTISIYKKYSKGENIIYIGEDLKISENIIRKGKKITPLDIGIMSTASLTDIEVVKPLTFTIISTGDEIIEAGQKQQLGQIRDINSPILEGLLDNWGCITTRKIIVKDNFEKIKNAVTEGLSSSLGVILSGGSSVGEKDYTYEVIKSFEDSEVFVHGIKLKPGKPTIIGKVGTKPVFGLPGHPVSAVIVFKIIVANFLKFATGYVEDIEKYVVAELVRDIHPASGRLTCQVVRLRYDGLDITAEPVNGKSGLISLLSNSHGYVKIPLDSCGFKKGDKVMVVLL